MTYTTSFITASSAALMSLKGVSVGVDLLERNKTNSSLLLSEDRDAARKISILQTVPDIKQDAPQKQQHESCFEKMIHDC